MSKYKKPLTPEEIATLGDEDIDFSDIPELDDNFFDKASVSWPPTKKQLT